MTGTRRWHRVEVTGFRRYPRSDFVSGLRLHVVPCFREPSVIRVVNFGNCDAHFGLWRVLMLKSLIAVDLLPWGVAVNPAGTFAYVTNLGSDSVSVINLSTNTVALVIPV